MDDQMNLKVFYDDGEVDTYEGVEFEAFDLESIAAPMLGALIFEHKDKQYCIMLEKVKKLEFTDIED